MPTMRVRAVRDDEFAAWMALWQRVFHPAEPPGVAQYRKALRSRCGRR